MADKVRRVDWSPDEWLSGTRGLLTMRELAVYDFVLNTIYSRGRDCPDDAAFVLGHFKPEYLANHRMTHARELAIVRAAIDQLVAVGKLHRQTTADGQRWLVNGRADHELAKARGRIVSASRAGIASGKARRAKAATNSIHRFHRRPE